MWNKINTPKTLNGSVKDIKEEFLFYKKNKDFVEFKELLIKDRVIMTKLILEQIETFSGNDKLKWRLQKIILEEGELISVDTFRFRLASELISLDELINSTTSLRFNILSILGRFLLRDGENVGEYITL